MQRGETDPAVQRDQGRVPFDVVPNLDYRVDQSADEEAVRRSRESNLDGQARRQSKDEESGVTAMGDDNVNEKEFEVTWDGDDDPMNPRSMPYARKWIIVIIVSASSLCVTCTSALYTSTYAQLEPEFGCSRIVATLGLSLFVMGLGCGPMVMSPLSEFYGRRPIYIASYAFFLIWLIPCAVAQNIATMLVARFFDGLAGSAFLSVAGGTVGDLFPKTQLSLPMAFYTAAPFVGPEIGPIVGGFINYNTSWRWTFYVLLIWSGIMLAAIIFLVPETYHPVLLRKKAITLRKDTGNQAWRAPIENMDESVFRTVAWSCVRPFQLLFLEAMCLNLCILSAILLGILYLFFGAFPLVFENNHGFVLWQTGLTFIGIFVGMVTGVSCDPIWRRNYNRLVTKNGGVSEPEFRLPPTILGAILVPIGIFGFGWTTYSSVMPIVFSGIFGLGKRAGGQQFCTIVICGSIPTGKD
ncbi:MFS general substrate transporter [Aureobasidium subglaciale]|nr:MFS general substrate transporter [Aureobasidium subglaciale]KAI5218446.1 MFS general substrate transporter [Aureobasidium subglaciale]KAI5256051.1 MFS general substrate transporter [Aureobasidium subglaciale]